MLKISHTLLADYVGDLLITQAGEFGFAPRLFIVHWDGVGFVTRSITLPDTVEGRFEQVTFAPITLPDL